MKLLNILKSFISNIFRKKRDKNLCNWSNYMGIYGRHDIYSSWTINHDEDKKKFHIMIGHDYEPPLKYYKEYFFPPYNSTESPTIENIK